MRVRWGSDCGAAFLRPPLPHAQVLPPPLPLPQIPGPQEHGWHVYGGYLDFIIQIYIETLGNNFVSIYIIQ